MRWTHSACTLLTIALVAGCSSSETAEVDEDTKQVSDASASTLPTVAELRESGGLPDNADDLVTPFAENLNFFTAPKTFIPTEPEEVEIDLSGELPPLRLVGFVGAAGDKAMVHVDGKMHIVKAGKSLKGIEIVSVESPNVGIRWGATELTLNFYEPSKANRRPRKAAPSFTFSPVRSDIGSRPNNNNPRPPTVLPPLSTVPTPDKAAVDNLSDFPDLGSAPPAP